MEFFLWARRPYYRLKDALVARRQLRATGERIRELAEHKLFVTITSPAQAAVPELLDLAAGYGFRTMDLATMTVPKANAQLVALYADHVRRNRDLLLVHVPSGMAVTDGLPESVRRVLLMPSRKRYFKQLRRTLAAAELDLEMKQYDTLAADEELYPIILNETEPPRELFSTLIYKLECLNRLEQLRMQEYPETAADYQCFVLWGHGLAFRRELIELVGREFELVASAERGIADIKRFTREMYIEEVLRIGHHILKKNEHLARAPRRAVLLLVRSRPGIRTFDCQGHGRDKAVCTSFDQHFKQIIRDKYNPRLSSGERTEYHVIHAADTPFQVDNILRMFELKPLIEWLDHE